MKNLRHKKMRIPQARNLIEELRSKGVAVIEVFSLIGAPVQEAALRADIGGAGDN
jgi:hypothetical protein